jgi:hypothetical protein
MSKSSFRKKVLKTCFWFWPNPPFSSKRCVETRLEGPFYSTKQVRCRDVPEAAKEASEHPIYSFFWSKINDSKKTY